MSEKIYCGSGKQIDSQYGTFRSITVNLTDLPKEHIFEYNGKKYIKLNVNDKRETDQYGKNVSVSVDTWKPEPKGNQEITEPEEEDLPF